MLPLLMVHFSDPAAIDRAAAVMQRIRDPAAGTIVVAHRGCHNAAPQHRLNSAPENSIRALENCVVLGVDVMELDVRRTRDGHLVVIHDDTVDRTTNGEGRVADLTLAAIRSLRLRDNEGGTSAALTDERVPTLQEMLTRAKGRMVVNLDVKDAIYAEVVEVAVKLQAGSRVIVKSAAGAGSPPLAGLPPFDRVPFLPVLSASDDEGGDLAHVMRLQEQASPRPIGYELPRMDKAHLAAAAAEARRQNVRLWCNSLWEGFIRGLGGDHQAVRDPAAAWGVMLSSGISMIQTDEPEALLTYLDR